MAKNPEGYSAAFAKAKAEGKKTFQLGGKTYRTAGGRTHGKSIDETAGRKTDHPVVKAGASNPPTQARTKALSSSPRPKARKSPMDGYREGDVTTSSLDSKPSRPTYRKRKPKAKAETSTPSTGGRGDGRAEMVRRVADRALSKVTRDDRRKAQYPKLPADLKKNLTASQKARLERNGSVMVRGTRYRA